jgi:hypothetical protein
MWRWTGEAADGTHGTPESDTSYATKEEAAAYAGAFAYEGFIEATQPVLYAGGPVAELDTVRLDSALGGRSLYADAALRKYRAQFEVADRAALGAEESLRLIHSIEREL